MTGTVAVITGASSGLGAAVARALATRGDRVVVHGRREAATRAVADSCDGTAVVGDLRDPASRRALVATATAVHRRIDLLVCNAGVGWAGAFDAMPPERIEDLIATNLVAPIHLAREVLPGMLQRGCGQIVFVSSIAGRTGVAGEAVYAASKAGLDGFADSLRLEATGRPIGIHTLVPAVIETPFFERRGAPYTRRTPGPQTPERVAAQLIALLESGRPEAWTNPSLRMAAILRSSIPGVYTRLAARWGSPDRLGDH